MSVKINCKNCDKEIITFPSRIGRKKYCSYKCRAIDNPAPNFIKGHKGFGPKVGIISPGGFLKKGIYKNPLGYIYIHSPNHPNRDVRNYVAEHRLVVEKHIGRFLLKTEVVHHKNGIKDDNRIENLELFKNQSEHIKHEYIYSNFFREKSKEYQFKKGLKRCDQISLKQHAKS